MEITKEFFKEGALISIEGTGYGWWKGPIEEPYGWTCFCLLTPDAGDYHSGINLPNWVTSLKYSDLLIREYITEVNFDGKALIPFIMMIKFDVLLDKFKELNTFIENLIRELETETNPLVKTNFTRWVSELMKYRHDRYAEPHHQKENIYGVLPKMDLNKPATLGGMNVEFSTTGITSVDFSLDGRQVTIKGRIDSIEMK